MGVYHTGIQIEDDEYRFGGHSEYESGVCRHDPRDGMGVFKFKYSILLGEAKLSASEIDEILDELEIDFVGKSYDIFKKNCNHFSNNLATRLLGKPIPSFVFDVSEKLKFTRCIIPRKLLRGGVEESP